MRNNDDIAILDKEIEGYTRDLAQIKSDIALYEGMAKRLEDKIKAAMGDKTIAVNDSGDVLATWKYSKGRITIDMTGLQKECLEIYERFKKIGSDFKVFKLNVRAI
jgi:predicted phage-related endonuclease